MMTMMENAARMRPIAQHHQDHHVTISATSSSGDSSISSISSSTQHPPIHSSAFPSSFIAAFAYRSRVTALISDSCWFPRYLSAIGL
jgi:hypothetical protein